MTTLARRGYDTVHVFTKR